jgi:hypothetical protein
MIITRINGGLGNQMFQYAAGRRLADNLGVELKVDLNGMHQLDGSPLEDINKVHFYYRLKFMNIRAEIATNEDLRQFDKKEKGIFGKLKGYSGRLQKTKPGKRFMEGDFEFDPAVLELGDNTLLDGFWQSEKYFNDIADELRNDFSFKLLPEGKNLELANQIERTNAVFILVRRGALVNDPKTSSVHGYCNLGFYTECANLMASKVKAPVFYVFSDEPEWAEQYLKLDYPCVYVGHNGREFYHDDLRLMSLCKHGISSNSTWSWWGAWLIKNPEKIIMAPKKWFKASINTKDLIPENWVLI